MPVLKKRPLLEKDIQKKVVDYAKEKGWRPFKRSMFAGYGKSGDPDYEFNGHHRHTFFIEFKAPGKECTPKQLKAHEELCALGFTVYVIDDVERGVLAVNRETAARDAGWPNA